MSASGWYLVIDLGKPYTALIDGKEVELPEGLIEIGFTGRGNAETALSDLQTRIEQGTVDGNKIIPGAVIKSRELT